MSRHYYRRSGLFGFLEDIFDDVWDFIDDDILDRGWDTEHDFRRAGRRWFDDDYYDVDRRHRRWDGDRRYERHHNRRHRVSRHRRRDDAVHDLHDEIAALIEALERYLATAAEESRPAVSTA